MADRAHLIYNKAYLLKDWDLDFNLVHLDQRSAGKTTLKNFRISYQVRLEKSCFTERFATCCQTNIPG